MRAMGVVIVLFSLVLLFAFLFALLPLRVYIEDRNIKNFILTAIAPVLVFLLIFFSARIFRVFSFRQALMEESLLKKKEAGRTAHTLAETTYRKNLNNTIEVRFRSTVPLAVGMWITLVGFAVSAIPVVADSDYAFYTITTDHENEGHDVGEYNFLGKLKALSEYTKEGNLERRLEYHMKDNGQIDYIERFDGYKSLVETSRFSYSDGNLTVTITSPKGITTSSARYKVTKPSDEPSLQDETTFDYDEDGMCVTTTTEFNEAHIASRKTERDENGETLKITTYSFDDNGKYESSTTVDGSGEPISSFQCIRDEEGALIRVETRDANGAITRVDEYDPSSENETMIRKIYENELLSRIITFESDTPIHTDSFDENGKQIWSTELDESGRKTLSRHLNTNGIEDYYWVYQYDVNVQQVFNPDGSVRGELLIME